MKDAIYLPFLRAKEGEFWALKNLHPNVKKKIAPFFDIGKPEKKSVKPIGKHLSDVARNIADNWGTDHLFYVDIPSINSALKTTSGTHCLEHLHSSLSERLLNPILVCALDRDDEFIQVCKSLLVTKQGRMCLRLYYDDIGISLEELSQQIDHLLRTLKTAKDRCDLVLDLQIINEKNVDDKRIAVSRFLASEAMVADWVSIALTASSFPNSLAGLKKGEITEITRNDFLFWQNISDQSVYRDPIFGDYGIVSPNFSDQIDYGKMKLSPITKIRYTTDTKWIVVKAENAQKPRREHYRKLSNKMIAHKLYMGGTYSCGDGFIQDSASGKDGSGALTRWVGVDWNHHITHVVNQLSK